MKPPEERNQERVQARVRVSGRVQGVWFRASTRDAATRFGVGGWVRNLPDGRVEMLLEGERASVEEMMAWCSHGSPLSRVDQVEVEWEESVEPFDDFAITR